MYVPSEIELEGPPFSLRPLKIEDAEQLWNAANQDRANYNYNNVPSSLELTGEYIASALAMKNSGMRYPFAIRQNGIVVGTTSYFEFTPWNWPAQFDAMNGSTPDICEIGYTWLASSLQRTGCNTVCKYLLLKYAFEEWKVFRVSFRTDERNSRSRKAIERIGAKFEGIRRADMPGRDGTVRNSAYYSILLSEWPNVKKMLEAKMNIQY